MIYYDYELMKSSGELSYILSKADCVTQKHSIQSTRILDSSLGRINFGLIKYSDSLEKKTGSDRRLRLYA